MTDGADSLLQEAHGELSLARVALADDDLRHAANHVANAITCAPGLPEIHELLAALAVRGGDGGLSLFPLEGQAYLGTVVAHAHLLSLRDPANALILLARATAFDPGKPWADVPWVRAFALETLDPAVLTQVFVTMMRSLGDPATADIRLANEVYLDLADRAVRAHPDDALVHGTAAGVCRRIGDTALAVRWGKRAVRLQPSKLTYVWCAYALKADGRFDDALRMMALARRHNPGELDLCADMANWLAQAGRIDEALVLIEEAMRLDPAYDCAVHTAHRLRFQRDGDPRHLVALVDFIRDNPETSHEHADLEEACTGQPWLGLLAGPTEACINVLVQIPPEDRGEGSLSLSGLEAPSALAVLRRECPGIEVKIEGLPPAGMVTPLRPGRVLWRYDGTTAYPTVEPASASSAALLAGLASPTWPHPVAAYDHALPLGQLPVEELLSLLVHPPARPERCAGLPDGWWERTAQVFACLGILHCAQLSSGVPGDTSAQRRLLAEIAFGIEDWTTEAALFALAVAAWLDPACRAEVADVVGRRFLATVAAAEHRPVTVQDSVAVLVQLVPGVAEEVLVLARAVTGVRRGARAPVAPAKRSLLRRMFGR